MTIQPVHGTVRLLVGLDLVGWDEFAAAAYVAGYAIAIAVGSAVVGWLL